MPRYDFICQVCGVSFEKQLPYGSDTTHVTCPNGHSRVRRLYSAPQVIFKGSGFYVTDHRRSGGTSKSAGSA